MLSSDQKNSVIDMAVEPSASLFWVRSVVGVPMDVLLVGSLASGGMVSLTNFFAGI